MEIDNKSLYDVLGVSQNATKDEIKKAYRKSVMKYPPGLERGPSYEDQQKVEELNRAYEILSNEEKRIRYDQTGEIESGPGGIESSSFDSFWRNFGKMGKSDEGTILVSLEDIYKGTVIQVGGDRVFIERGYDTQTRAISNGKSYKVEVKRHKVFERKKDNLFMKKTISLKESLLGFSFTVRHLDGKDILISSVPGEVIENRSVKMIVGKGMPIFHDTEDNFGNLCIEFVVEFPKSIKLDHSEAPYFSELGEEGRPEDLGIETERVYLSDVYWNETNSVPRGGNSEDIDDAISSEEKNKVQCNVQ